MGDSGRLSRGLYPRVGRRSETVKGSTGGRLFGAVGDCSELVTVYPFLEKIRAFSYSPKREGPQVGLIVLCLRVYVRAIIGGSAVLQGGQILGQLYMRVVICPDPPRNCAKREDQTGKSAKCGADSVRRNPDKRRGWAILRG